MAVNPNILVVTLGGTIESFYDPKNGTPKDVPLEQGAEATVIPQVMKTMGLAEGCDFYPVAMRDSKYVSTAELDHVLQYAGEQGYSKILVVQGTDTMPVHGQYLERRIEELQEHLPSLARASIVLTGAMGPLRDAAKQWRDPAIDRRKNDGWANLRQARRDVELNMPGAFVRIGQNLWPASRVKKVVQLGQ